LAQVWTDIGTDCQEWYLVQAGGLYYKIVNKNSHHVLEVINALTADGAPIRQWEYNGHDCQLWRLKRPANQTGIEVPTEEDQQAKIYQPAKGILEIEMPANLIHKSELRVFNQIGQPKLRIPLHTKRTNVNITDKLNLGLYIAKITDAKGSTIRIQKIFIE
jgi:hypothetical protein